MSPHLHVKSVIRAVRRIQASQILQLDLKNHLLMRPHKVLTARLSFTADLSETLDVIYSISVLSFLIKSPNFDKSISPGHTDDSLHLTDTNSAVAFQG